VSEPRLSCPFEQIGVVRTGRTVREATPVQSSLNRDEHGILDIFEPYVEGLTGLDGFDYAWLLTWLDRPDSPGAPAPLTQVPFLLRPQQRQMGIFATRGPRRVNPIGLSLVHVLAVEDRSVRFGGVDLLDGTPVIDLKPYVSRFDRPEGEPRCGWFDTVEIRDGVTPVDLGPPQA
jgi:tRNA-Thr(GGU) m(6)t(6)A37 methyltransferase TsaA